MLLTRRSSGLSPAVAADEAGGVALLNCLVREVCGPEQQVWRAGGRLAVRLPRVGIALRARLARPGSYGPSLRLAPPIEELRAGSWTAVSCERLADLVAGELELAAGRPNPEFTGQVAASRAALAAILATRGRAAAGDDAYLASEQALVAGHRFHPAPKARAGEPACWLGYAPEVRARFPLHWLAVRADLITGEGDFTLPERLVPPVPDGYAALPVHPWQRSLLDDRPLLRAALAGGAVRDLGPRGPAAVATSSVRTVYLPDADLFCKFSLDVRITNCVRKNAWYELAGAPVLSRLLGPVFAALGEAYGCALLAEPAFRSVVLADRRLHEGLGVILRAGVRGPAGAAGTPEGTPLVAGALADPYGSPLRELLAGHSTPAWWAAYVRRVVPPVLHAFLAYGVVLEPHLQNVLIRVDGGGLPVQAIFRDMEGTKLLAGHWDRPGASRLRDLPARVREAMTYDEERGWRRVVYCLFVNHLAELAAAIADLRPAAPELERDLWRAVRDEVARYAAAHGSALAEIDAARLRALLAGVPLPAKANLMARWARAADRAAPYVMVRSPFADLAAWPPDVAAAELSRAATAPTLRGRARGEPPG